MRSDIIYAYKSQREVLKSGSVCKNQIRKYFDHNLSLIEGREKSQKYSCHFQLIDVNLRVLIRNR